jgi:ABC transporter substrate binding protein
MTNQFFYRRRELITLALSVATASVWSLSARAQPRAWMPVIGFLDTTGLVRWFDAFQEGLKELGYVPGQTISIERRVGAPARLPDLAAELVRLQPKVIVASGSRAALAAKNATTTIPIVLAFATDPVELGLVASLAQPGGNITGSRTRARAWSARECSCWRRSCPAFPASVSSRKPAPTKSTSERYRLLRSPWAWRWTPSRWQPLKTSMLVSDRPPPPSQEASQC